ncbi:MAG: hypothetical protein Q8J74_13515 [Candidatus Didemnitutus sp.]|nr:hypothetical protein [Candidatus Didemnitutus sp.]
MDFRATLSTQRHSIATAALAVAKELEAGRAQAPFQEKFATLASKDTAVSIRVGILAPTPDVAHALLADFLGPDYNVCKIVVPSRLGYSEVLLQERGFLLDAGDGAREFADAGTFIDAIKATHALESKGDVDLEPLRVKLKGPAHLTGLCLLIPQSIDALVRKPALLSTLADQADWVFLAGTAATKIAPPSRQAIQLILDNVTGLQNVLVPAEGEIAEAEEWWKGWKAGLSLGLVKQGSDLLRTRLSLLTAPDSELRQYLVEVRLWRQLETGLALLVEESEQAQRMLGNRLSLTRDGLVGPGANGDLRKILEGVRQRFTDETENVIRTIDREAKAALAPAGEINRHLRTAAANITADDIEQTMTESLIKLTPAAHIVGQLVQSVSELYRQRLANDIRLLNDGLECSIKDAEAALEKSSGLRHKLAFDPIDEQTLWETISHAARPEIRYRSEMPRPTLGSRFNAARQTIMGVMIAGTVLGGAATLVGDGGQNVRTTLYALMLPLLVIGFLWTYVSFRKKERLTLEKEVEKFQDGVLGELRRVLQELHREQLGILNTSTQKLLRSISQQADDVLSRLDQQRQRDAEDQRRKQSDQQRTMEQRVGRLRQFTSQLTTLQSRFADARKLQSTWLSEWISKFNQGKV